MDPNLHPATSLLDVTFLLKVQISSSPQGLWDFPVCPPLVPYCWSYPILAGIPGVQGDLASS
jgi:hypothetical protein